MTFKSFYSKEYNSNSVIESMIVGKKDQRGFHRMDIDSEVTFRVLGSDESFIGKTKDLSATGLSFQTDKQVSAGDTLHISVKPGKAITPPLEVMVTVIRVIPSDNEGYIVAGEIRQQDA